MRTFLLLVLAATAAHGSPLSPKREKCEATVQLRLQQLEERLYEMTPQEVKKELGAISNLLRECRWIER